MNLRLRNMTKAYWRFHKVGPRGKEFWEKMMVEHTRFTDLDKFLDAVNEEFERLSRLPKYVDETGLIIVGNKKPDRGE